MSTRPWIVLALAGLAVLVAVSVGLAWSTARTSGGAPLPPGVVLAVVKVAALAFVFRRVRAANVYSMQWASMFILLFMAEGLVRATSDPRPSSILGVAEAVAAACTFVALLAHLRPIKRRARGRDA